MARRGLAWGRFSIDLIWPKTGVLPGEDGKVPAAVHRRRRETDVFAMIPTGWNSL